MPREISSHPCCTSATDGKEDPLKFSNAVKGLLKGRSIMKRNILHHIEASRIVEIIGSKIKVMGMSNHRIKIFLQMKK